MLLLIGLIVAVGAVTADVGAVGSSLGAAQVIIKNSPPILSFKLSGRGENSCRLFNISFVFVSLVFKNVKIVQGVGLDLDFNSELLKTALKKKQLCFYL